MTNTIAPRNPRIQHGYRDAALQPENMIDWALASFGADSVEWVANQHATDAIMADLTPENAAAILARLADIRTDRFDALHESAVYAARVLSRERPALIRQFGAEVTDAWIRGRAARYGVVALPTHFGVTALPGFKG